MPTTKRRTESNSAKRRIEKEYIFVDDKANPYHMYIPKTEYTEQLRKLMNGKNFIRIMTKIDKNQYIVVQYYIYAEPDLWICGDALVLNQNPDKKIWCKTMCSATKAPCVCYDEDAKIFLTVCPYCYYIGIAIKDTTFQCQNCKHVISHKDVNDLPFVKIPCKMCPKEIGWEEAQRIRHIIADRLVNRSHVTLEVIKNKLTGELKELTTSVKDAEERAKVEVDNEKIKEEMKQREEDVDG